MATYSYSDAVNAARLAAVDDPVAQTGRSSAVLTSGNSTNAPTTTDASRRYTANQIPVPTTKTNNNSLSGSSSIKASTSKTAASTTSAPVTQTPAPTSTSSNQTDSHGWSFSSTSPTTSPTTPSTAPTATQPATESGTRGWSFSASSPTTTATTPATTPEATPAAATPEAASEETPKTTAYTPTTVRTTTATNNKSTTDTQKSTPATYTPTGIYDPNNLKAYNDQRVADIRSLYEQALQNSLAGMRTAYDQNMSDAQAARDQISPQYQRSMNALSAEYERQRRNNNMQAAANGLNSGAGSQMALAQSANYQANQAGLSARENEALNEANRRIGDLQRNYQNAIAEATANNNYKLAASLMEEYQNAYNRQMQIENTNYQRAQQIDQQNYTRSWNEDEREYSRGIDEANRKAQYGDFSGYAALYGDDAARLMEQTWAMQNPYQAWASGKLSAEDFYAITGKLPANPADVADQLAAYGDVSDLSGNSSSPSSSSSGYNGFSFTDEPGGTYTWRRSRMGFDGMKSKLGDFINLGKEASGSNNKKSRYSGRGYSASRDRAYRGAPGYLNTNGEFVTGWSNDNPYEGHEKDYAVAQAYADAYSQSKDKYVSNLYAQDNYQNYMPNGASNLTTSGITEGTIDRRGLH